MTWCLVLVTALAVVASRLVHTTADECKLTPVVHVLQYPGCVAKPIPSYACVGHCTSYVQVSSGAVRCRNTGADAIFSERIAESNSEKWCNNTVSSGHVKQVTSAVTE